MSSRVLEDRGRHTFVKYEKSGDLLTVWQALLQNGNYFPTQATAFIGAMCRS